MASQVLIGLLKFALKLLVMRRLLFLFLLFSAQLSLGQITLKGIIVDENTNPLPLVNIALFQKADSSLLKGYITEQDGSFKINLAENADYFITLSYVGYEDHSIRFSSSVDLGLVALKPQSATLEDVVVTSQRPMIHREQDRLIVNVEGSILSTGNSTLEILEKSPGIIVDQDGNLSMNGRSGVRVYIDDKDTRLQGDQLANLLRSMPSGSIERIELITNPSVKYEAAGNAGIINIVTKRGKFYGTNGSVTLSPGYGRYFRWENSLQFNHRTEKWNLYGQYAFAKRNQYMEIVIDRIFLEEGQPSAVFALQNDFRLPIENHTPRLGFDFMPSERTTIGVLVSGLANLTGSDAFSDIDEFSPNARLVSQQTTDTYTETEWYQFTANFNARHTFANKSLLDFDFDYARYNNNSDQRFFSQFLDEEDAVLFENTLAGTVDGGLHLAGLTLDYELPFSNGTKLEAGWKNTWVKTDNDLQYTDEINGIVTPNDRLSNHFIYDEAIYAAYLNYNITKETWNANLGLRGEKTLIEGDQLTTQETFDNDYLNFFPSISFNYTFSPKHLVGLSVGRRIDRPSYNDLNPFRFFINTNTFRIGNPYLTPQFTWNTELNYTFKQRYYFALSYGYTIDNLNRAILQEGDEQAVVVKPINIKNLKSYALVASIPIQFTKWWSSQWNLTTSLNDFNSDIEGFQFDQLNPIYVINTSHNISLGKGYRIQLGWFYLPPHYGTITKIRGISNVSFGLQKNILGGKGNIRFNFNDIFYQSYPRGQTIFGNIDDTFLSFRDSRFATLSFTLNFGKQSVKPQRRRQSGVQEELNRARQGENN